MHKLNFVFCLFLYFIVLHDGVSEFAAAPSASGFGWAPVLPYGKFGM